MAQSEMLVNMAVEVAAKNWFEKHYDDLKWKGLPPETKMIFRELVKEYIEPVAKGLMETHVPVRGNDVELWIKMRRDSYPTDSTAWTHLDMLLDEYRLASDTGSGILEDQDDTD